MLKTATRFSLTHYLPIVWVVTLVGFAWCLAVAFLDLPDAIVQPGGLILFAVAGWLAFIQFRDTYRNRHASA